MEEAPENGKESPHSVHANGLISLLIWIDWEKRSCRFSNNPDWRSNDSTKRKLTTPMY